MRRACPLSSVHAAPWRRRSALALKLWRAISGSRSPLRMVMLPSAFALLLAAPPGTSLLRKLASMVVRPTSPVACFCR
jgi:hypothetical protein